MKSPRLCVCILAAVCWLPATESKADEPDKADKAATDSMVGKKAGELRDDNGMKMKLVWCPPGKFKMGISSPELILLGLATAVDVELSNGFWLGKCEVTQADWKRVMATEPWAGEDRMKSGDDYPAMHVSWEDVMAFCCKLTERERRAGRLPNDWEFTLPTEAQWELACRARTETNFSFGEDESKLGEYAWFLDNAENSAEQYAHRVGQKKPNSWGLCDMHGNVWEWCRDRYSDKLPGGRDPEAIREGSRRVTRGGGWNYDAAACNSASRFPAEKSGRSSYVGFRVALRPIGNK